MPVDDEVVVTVLAERDGDPIPAPTEIGSDHELKMVDALLTGLHEPEASHLDLLTAFLPAPRIKAAYSEAIREGYLWHEFGDLNLII